MRARQRVLRHPGALPEAEADGISYPGTYVAGLYNRLATEIAGRMVVNEDLVNVPNWLLLAFRVAGGPWFDVQQANVLDHRLELDMRHGTLLRRLAWEDGEGRRTRIVQRRFVSMKDEHLAGLETTFTAENWSGTLEVRSGLDGRVVNAGVKRYRDLNGRHLAVLDQAEVDKETVDLQVETTQSHVRVALAARTRLLREGRTVEAGRRPGRRARLRRPRAGPRAGAGAADDRGEGGRPLHLRDRAISESRTDARLTVAGAEDFAGLLARHEGAWNSLWNRFDVQLDSANEWTETVLHLHIFHLLQTVSPHTLRLDVGPARGWHGRPISISSGTSCSSSRSSTSSGPPGQRAAGLPPRPPRRGLLAARLHGYRGAMFPWQSGSNGQEETQEVHLNPKSGRWLADRSHRQRHVNIAIAYNVWQHYMVTGTAFLRFVGAELLIEIARFWASIATYDREQDRYEIHGVMGPDEYHEGYPDSEEHGLRNNTYTNVMVVWVLRRALEALEVLPPHYRQELVSELTIQGQELDRWREMTRKMKVVFHRDGVLTQFEGYESLREFDWEGYREKYGDIQRLDRVLEAEGDTTDRYKVAKQADVLMLLFLLSRDELRGLPADLGYDLSEEQLARTVAYYLERTSHGSTLSGVVSAWVLARYQPEEVGVPHASAGERHLRRPGRHHRRRHPPRRMAGTVDIVLAASPACEPAAPCCGSTQPYRPRSSSSGSASTTAATASTSSWSRTAYACAPVPAEPNPSRSWCGTRWWSWVGEEREVSLSA